MKIKQLKYTDIKTYYQTLIDIGADSLEAATSTQRTTISGLSNSPTHVKYLAQNFQAHIGLNAFHRPIEKWGGGAFLPPNTANGEVTTSATDVILSPNPTTGIIQLYWATSETEIKITLLDINGRRILSERFDSDTKGAGIDLSAFMPGIYMVKIYYDGKVENKKIILIK